MNSFSFGSASSSSLSLAPNLTSSSPIAAAAPPIRFSRPSIAAGAGVDRLEVGVLGRLALMGLHRSQEASRRRELAP